MSVLDIFRATVGAAALGFARRALDETLKRVAERKLFGAPLAELQMVQGHIADMALDIDAAALLVYRAAWTKDMGAARVSREASMAKLFATERAQVVIDTGRAAARRGGRPQRVTGRAALPGDPCAPHLRGRVRRAEDRDRAAGSGRTVMLGPSAHLDTFARDHLPPPEQWPQFNLAGFDYPEHVNVGVELTDRMVEKGFGDNTALIGHGRLRTYKELADWTNRLAHALVEDLGIVPGNRILIRSANNPAMVACWCAALKAGAVVINTMPTHAGRRSHQGDRQGGGEARALRHAPDGRAGDRREDQQVPEEGDRLRRHRQFRCRARPHRAGQVGDFPACARRAATMSRSSPSRPARPASRRPRCICIATYSPSPTAMRKKC